MNADAARAWIVSSRANNFILDLSYVSIYLRTHVSQERLVDKKR